MALNIGNDEVMAVKLGEEDIEVYLGDEKLYPTT